MVKSGDGKDIPLKPKMGEKKKKHIRIYIYLFIHFAEMAIPNPQMAENIPQDPQMGNSIPKIRR